MGLRIEDVGKNPPVEVFEGVGVDYVFCLTGDNSSRWQGMNEHMAINSFIFSGKKVGIRVSKSADVFEARNGCLTGKTKSFRADQVPFYGCHPDYKAMIWIDSDNYVMGPQIKRLIDYDVDIVAGWSRIYSLGNIDDTNRTNVSFKRMPGDAKPVRSILVGEMATWPRNERGLIEVDHVGMALMVVRRGVFEAIGYPWFKSWQDRWEDNGVKMVRNISDDEGFCIRAREAGFKIYVDPRMKIDHEKKVAL